MEDGWEMYLPDDEPTLPSWSRASDIRTLTLGNGCQGSWTLSHLYDDLPDAIWFILGTATHLAFEKVALEEVTTLEGALAVAYAEKERLMREALDVGIIESARAKRGIATVDQDIELIVSKWWSDVHPSSPTRMSIYESYEWPPSPEVVIDYGSGEDRLVTTIDAVFTAKETGDTLVVDWKTGSSKSSHESQLQIYTYGLRQLDRLEGHYSEIPLTLGWFHHAAHGKLQPVTKYWGDDVIAAMIRSTYRTKANILDYGETVFNPDWWCGFCTAKGKCPVMGEGELLDIRSRIVTAGFQESPAELGETNDE